MQYAKDNKGGEIMNNYTIKYTTTHNPQIDHYTKQDADNKADAVWHFMQRAYALDGLKPTDIILISVKPSKLWLK